SSDDELNRIWDIGEYTMRLTTREFFIDGIKRDRWVWSGDAIQSYLMNYYLYFDSETVRSTIWLLRGKDPVTSHTNTIMDYTFYWFLSIYDYYLYTGDDNFIRQIYPRMQSMMDYVLGRTNANGMVEGMTGDWVFVDWADGYLDKKGELSYEQVLFAKSLETMAQCAAVSGDTDNGKRYDKLAKALISKLEPAFWNDKSRALVHNRIDGTQQSAVTRYSNMFAVFFNSLSPEKKEQIKHSVLLNDSILKITTPYMRFYELEALCAMGEHSRVMKEMKDYWGGMLNQGATSFWEKYNPDDEGREHLAMYGRPYGKSLCHAWGASPIYLLGKYYIGIQPLKAGYSEYSVQPHLGGLKWMEGSVPTPDGDIRLRMDERTISIEGGKGTGWLTFESRTKPKASRGTPEKTGDRSYKLRIDGDQPVTVRYRSL
ncbi:MAG: alpha-L-rhamnosidase C-terminal domain-containing protein, partial [Paludibacter sp.]|nr:alpha-L-rhamnosidase C-terminal domain-containing protein [Paludibacter sp.]